MSVPRSWSNLVRGARHYTTEELLDMHSNPFFIPHFGLHTGAGQALRLEWKPTTSSTVSLLLCSEHSSNFTIASNIPNDGNFTWFVPGDVIRGSDYAVKIVDDSDPSKMNYTPMFAIQSKTLVQPKH